MKKLTLSLLLCLVGCATSSQPPKDVYVSWSTPCSDGPQVYRVKFVDTQVPLLACVQRSIETDQKGTAGKLVLLTLMGFPASACTISWPGTGYAELYAPISPTPAQVLIAVNTLMPPQDLLHHELEHVFGEDHVTALPILGRCREKT
jgi:hypothetical protein